MPRVFGCAAIAHLILLVSTGVLGLAATGVRTQRHVILAVFTLILGCLLQILAFMYLAVSSKMMRQAVHLGRLDVAPLRDADRRRRRVTYVLPVFLASIVLSTATGAAHWRGGQMGTMHLLCAGASTVVQLACWYVDFVLIVEQSTQFGTVMRAYEVSRRAMVTA